MKLIDRYIGQVVLGHTVAVLLTLLSLYFISDLVGELGDVGKGRYTTVDAILYSLMLTPRQAYELFPLAALLGCMLGLGALVNTSELTVIRAAGVSIQRIVLSVLMTGAVMVVVVSVMGELVAPQLEKEARMARAEALGKRIGITSGGLWARDENAFINIREFLASGEARNVYLYFYDDKMQLSEMVHAQKGEYSDEAWRLQQVSRTLFHPQSTEVLQQEGFVWRSKLAPEVMNMVVIPPENLSIRDLYGYIGFLEENRLEARRYELSFWMRVMMPFSTAVMMLLAIPFIFGSMRSVSVGQRVMIGALIGISFYFFNGIFTRFGLLYELPLSFSAAAPTVVAFIIWLVLMRRVKG